MNKNILIGIVVIIVLTLGGWWIYSMSQPAEKPNTQTGTITNHAPVHYEVIYTDNGFSPSNVTVNAGDTVTFKNQSSGGMWVGSANHPSHTLYSGTSLQQHCPDAANNAFDECQSAKPGESWSFTFTKTGTWGYHNHMNSAKTGTITVEQ